MIAKAAERSYTRYALVSIATVPDDIPKQRKCFMDLRIRRLKVNLNFRGRTQKSSTPREGPQASEPDFTAGHSIPTVSIDKLIENTEYFAFQTGHLYSYSSLLDALGREIIVRRDEDTKLKQKFVQPPPTNPESGEFH
jgi:hypothetical protein